MLTQPRPEPGSAAEQQQASANLSALIESTEDLIWSIDLNYGILTFNSALQRHVERHFGEQVAVGKRPEDLLPPERAAIWPPLFERALTRGPFRAEIPFPNDRILEMSFNPIVVHGKLAGLSMFGKDVTERNRAEREQREMAEFLNETQRIGALGSYVLDISSGLWTSSEVMDGLFGIDKEYLRTVDGWVQLIHPDDRDMMAAYFETEVLGRRKPFDKEYRIVRMSDQAVRWFHGMGKLEFDADGQPARMRGAIKDITESKLAELNLRDSEERYRSTFEQATVGLSHSSFDGWMLRSNARFAAFLGYTPEELIGMDVEQLTAPEDRAETLAVRRRVSTGAVPTATMEKRYIRKDGALTWGKLTLSVQRDNHGRPLHFIALIEDINALKEAEQHLAKAQDELRQSEQRYRTVFQTCLDGVLISRLEDGRYVDFNQAFLDMIGYEREEAMGRSSAELNVWTDPGDRERLARIQRQNSTYRSLELKLRRKNGEIFWGQVSASRIEIDSGPCVLSIVRDISGAKAAEEEIRNLAFYDPLTGLPNRRLLLERLRQYLASTNRSGRRRALLFIDLDDFKTLNDNLGHHIGDLLLQEAARRLTACVRDGDTVGRLGGDEFVVMLEELSEVAEEAATQAKLVGEKILAAIARPYLLDGRECRSSASIGISVLGNRREITSEVLQQADLAMYHAKTAGRNALRFFAPALQNAVNTRAALQEEMRLGIQAGQFVLHFQPQIDRNRLAGAEALLRWNHPTRDILAPGEFLPLAEATGLILPLGKWVLETACAQIAAWAHRKPAARLAIAVNISVRQFRQPEFVQQVFSALQQTGANPRNLRLELTESMLVENIEEVIAKMTELKSHGLRFALDDFGTGFSSLAYLKRLPLDQLKVGRSFMRGILTDQGSAAVVQTIISLSRAMGLPVIAEGVETEEQHQLLTRLGCHAFQGYLFSPPLPPDEFQRLWLSAAAGKVPAAGEHFPVPGV